MRSRRGRRRAHRMTTSGDLTLAAMVDMMVNILMFLLHLYGTDPALTRDADLDLARSTSTAPVEDEVVVVVSTDGASVDGDLVGSFALEGDLTELAGALMTHAAVDPEARSVVLEVDRAVGWPDLRRVLRAVSDAGYADVRFVVATGRREK